MAAYTQKDPGKVQRVRLPICTGTGRRLRDWWLPMTFICVNCDQPNTLGDCCVECCVDDDLLTLIDHVQSLGCRLADESDYETELYPKLSALLAYLQEQE